MSDPRTPGCDDSINEFAQNGGITNGAAWYSVGGGMQDFNYLASNDFEITLELGCDKYPTKDRLEPMWGDNKEALMTFMEHVHMGIKGMCRVSFCALFRGYLDNCSTPQQCHRRSRIFPAPRRFSECRRWHHFNGSFPRKRTFLTFWEGFLRG